MEIQNLTQEWQTLWTEKGYLEPTAIQVALYEKLKQGENVLGVSPTGTGKTVAYVLPLLERLTAKQGNQLLVMLPSQELAMQVTEVVRQWLVGTECHVQPIIGQANIKRQIERLKEKPEVIVGTPGRIYELVQQKKIKVHLMKTVVLDEVDQLLEHSELNAARNILKRLQHDTQLVGISATGKNIEESFKELVRRDYQLLDVSGELPVNTTVLHGYIRSTFRKRAEVLRSLAHVPHMRAIVFFNEVGELGKVSDKLNYEGVPNVTLASDQNKFERQGAIQAFQEKKVPFLLTTDLGARGLDFQEVDYVIHYDIPYEKESYVHRSGRTGRMNQTGTVMSFLNDNQMRDLKKVSEPLTESLQEIFLFGGQLSLEAPIKVAQPKVKKSKDKARNKKNTSKKKPKSK